MLALLASSWRSQEHTRPERLRQMCHRASASDREESAWAAGRDGLSEKQEGEGTQNVHRRGLGLTRRFCGGCLRHVKWAVMCGLAAETLDASVTCGGSRNIMDPNRQHRSFIGPHRVRGCLRRSCLTSVRKTEQKRAIQTMSLFLR
jgi:hypothetical protein